MKRCILMLCLLAVTPAGAVLEDFTTFTQTDPGYDITITSSTRIDYDGVERNKDAQAYKSYGAGHFGGDFTHTFQCGVNTTGTVQYSEVCPWAVANTTTGDRTDWITAAEDFAIFILYPGVTMQGILRLFDDGILVESDSTTISKDTTYYVTIERDDDGGANSTGQYTCYICTTNYYGESGSSTVSTNTIDCPAGEQLDYQYLYACQNRNTPSAGYPIDGWIEDLDIHETAAGTVPPLALHGARLRR